MELKVLGPQDYNMLKGTPGEELLTQDNSVVIIAEEDGKVIGHLALINLIHMEGAWVDPSRRSEAVIQRLEEAVLAKAKESGLKYVHVYAPTVEHETFFQRRGWERLPLSVWAKEL